MTEKQKQFDKRVQDYINETNERIKDAGTFIGIVNARIERRSASAAARLKKYGPMSGIHGVGECQVVYVDFRNKRVTGRSKAA